MGANDNHHEDAALRLASRRNLIVAVWTAAPSAAQFRMFSRVTERVVRSRSDGHALISVSLRGVPNFTQEARDELANIMKQRELFKLGAAHVILVPGLAGTAVRAFMSTVMLLAKPLAPHRVFGDKREAAGWVLSQLKGGSEPWTEREVLDAMNEAIAGR